MHFCPALSVQLALGCVVANRVSPRPARGKNICTKDVRKDRNENGFGFLSLLELLDDCTDGSNSQKPRLLRGSGPAIVTRSGYAALLSAASAHSVRSGQSEAVWFACLTGSHDLVESEMVHQGVP